MPPAAPLQSPAVPRRLVVVPDSDRVEQWLLDAALRADFVDLREVCTFTQLVDRCEAPRWAGRTPAEPLLVRCLLAAEAPALAAPAFGPAARTADFAAQVQDLLGHLRGQAGTWLTLAQAAAQAPAAVRGRAEALAQLWRRLDARLDELGLVERGDLLRLAAARLEADGLPPALAGCAALELRHVHDVSPARLHFLEALARACHRAGVRFAWHWPSGGSAAVDAFVVNAVREVEARWQGLDAELFPAVPDAPLAWVAREAFADDAAPRPAPELFALVAPTRREEARELARRVKRLTDAGVPPESLAVAFRDAGDDVEALLEALADLSVPARARLGVPLAASPVGRLALSLLWLADDDFPAQAVAAVLESRLTRALPPEAAEPRRAFLEAGVQDDALGAEGARGAYAVRLDALAARSPEEARRVRALAQGVERLLGWCRAIPAEGPAGALLEAWWSALGHLGLAEAVRRLEPRGAEGLLALEVDRALAREQAAVEALQGLLTALRRALETSGLAARRVARRDFFALVRRAAADVNLVARGPKAGAVWLLDARELPGRRFAHVFLGGLTDGRFPGRPPPLPLLSEEERTALNRLARWPLFRTAVGDDAARVPARLAEDRLLLHLALCSGAAVTLSRARVDEAGRELLPSPFLAALARAVEGFAPEVLARAAAPTLEAAQTEGELRVRAALEALSPPATRQSAPDRRGPALAAALGGEGWYQAAAAHAAAEAERLRFFGDEAQAAGPFSGLVTGAVLEALQPRFTFDAAHPVSAAELGTWGGCAFRGLAARVLGLEPPEPAGEEPSERTRGTFWHGALQRVVPRLEAAGLLGQDGPAQRAAVEAAVQEAAAAVAATEPVGHPAVWALGQRRAAGLVGRVVTGPAALPVEGARPAHAEVEFGTERAPEALREVVVPAALPGETPVWVRGAIDRVDLGPGVAAVVDYKGKVPVKVKERLLVSEFQMPLYLRAVQGLSAAPARGLWLGVRDAAVKELTEAAPAQLLAVDAPTREALAEAETPNLANAVHALLAQLRAGDFGARPVECTFCDFRGVCRISQRRLDDGGGE